MKVGPLWHSSSQFVKLSLFFFYHFMAGKEHFLYLLQLWGVKTATKDGVAQSGDGIG